MINPMTAATANIPTHTPALKMSPTSSQLDREIAVIINKRTYNEFFILIICVINFDLKRSDLSFPNCVPPLIADEKARPAGIKF